MNDESPPLIAEHGDDPAQRSLVDDVRQMVSDGRTLLEAELAYQKSRAAVAGVGAKGVAVWGALALALVFFTLMALIVGALLVLAHYLGPVLATGMVTGVLLMATLGAALAARSKWAHTARQLADQDPAP
ncbi:phage holin family protein [Novosphingobium sp.]|uniref:phage holin family protein n=1 Tax=Novosphingobium sp. TaxID=1874826 RepID=UPI00286ACAFA|nr:phage holin family protein [Novosphingobium sp.]